MKKQSLDTSQCVIMKRDFKNYLSRFRDENGRFSEPIKVKIAHTYRVVKEAKMLAESLGTDHETVDTAECAALLHDIGRFQQLVSFGTYDGSHLDKSCCA